MFGEPKPDQPDFKFPDLREIVKEVGLCKLAGLLDIGPYIKPVNGFDVLVYSDSVCYVMELCASAQQRISEARKMIFDGKSPK